VLAGLGDALDAIVARPLTRGFEERFNDGWAFRRGVPATKTRETAQAALNV